MAHFNAQQVLEEQDALLRAKTWRRALEHAQAAAAQYPDEIQAWELVDRVLSHQGNEVDEVG